MRMNKGTEIMNARQYFDEHQRALAALQHSAIDQIADELVKAYEGGKMMYLFGNGGSASLASHLACDLGKGTAYCNGGKRLRVLALTDNVATMTAWANDFSYEDMFSEQLRNFVQPQDIAFAISGSGNSKNVLNALRVAREAGATTIGISGYRGGEMKSLCDICAIVPSDNMQVIEDLHLAMAHSIFRIVYTRITQKSMSVASPG
jgi:D-sedoheptulose 7-phosphate isomerase